MNKVSVPMEELFPYISDSLKKNGKVTFRVTGWSMQPMLYNKRDSVTLIKPVFPLKKFDLPFYIMDDGRFLLHRVIKINEDGTYECRGDNRWTSENNIREDQIIGVVRYFNRNGKNIDVEKSLVYYIYTRLWCVLHHFKHLYKHWRYFKTTVRRRKEEILRPEKMLFSKEGDLVGEITYRFARRGELKEIQQFLCGLAKYETVELNEPLRNINWPNTATASKYFSDCIENHFFMVAICNKKVVGCLSGKIDMSDVETAPVATCGNIYVDEDYRGVGIASKLLDLFKKYCRENNCKHIKLRVSAGNKNAERLYRKNGFTDFSTTLLCRLED